jgi:methylmalonyl-CoA mutase
MVETGPQLELRSEFPPISTAAWETAVRESLGDAHAGRRRWLTDEGLGIKPFYRTEDWPGNGRLVHGAAGSWTMATPGAEPVSSVSVIAFQQAGATAIQEVAYALALGADRLASDQPVEALGFAIGSSYFTEVAKLRAARLLWAQVAAAFGVPSLVRIHARTSTLNKTLYDPYVNLLRVTTEALSAILGGCDTLTVSPFRFDAHLAENVQHILREESDMDKVADPAAGSYYVEALTDELARAAWRLFQEIETAGGMAAYTASGALEAAIGKAREAKQAAVAERRRILLGTNQYPDPSEKALDSAAEVPLGWRPAAVFERIRLRTERHAKATGKTPRILIIERGHSKVGGARARSCFDLFACGGFGVGQATQIEQADLIVLCGTDAEYVALAQEICSVAKAPVIVAGDLADRAEPLTAAGVAGFIDPRRNAAITLAEWQDRLGIEP